MYTNGRAREGVMAAAARRVSDEIQKTGWLMMKIAEGVTLVPLSLIHI